MKYNLSGKKISYLIFFFCFLFLFISSVTAEYIAPGVRLTPLTNDGRSVAAAWAYRGNKIAYLLLETDTQKQLMVMNSDGTNRQSITGIGSPYFVEWSWDSTKLSYLFSNAAD
ncbi:MAG: TolB-like translocation protein, partial [Planctomycetota bacterium]